MQAAATAASATRSKESEKAGCSILSTQISLSVARSAHLQSSGYSNSGGRERLNSFVGSSTSCCRGGKWFFFHSPKESTSFIRVPHNQLYVLANIQKEKAERAGGRQCAGPRGRKLLFFSSLALVAVSRECCVRLFSAPVHVKRATSTVYVRLMIKLLLQCSANIIKVEKRRGVLCSERATESLYIMCIATAGAAGGDLAAGERERERATGKQSSPAPAAERIMGCEIPASTAISISSWVANESCVPFGKPGCDTVAKLPTFWILARNSHWKSANMKLFIKFENKCRHIYFLRKLLCFHNFICKYLHCPRSNCMMMILCKANKWSSCKDKSIALDILKIYNCDHTSIDALNLNKKYTDSELFYFIILINAYLLATHEIRHYRAIWLIKITNKKIIHFIKMVC